MKHFLMTADALENYGEHWKGVVLIATHTATRYMPSKEFFDKGKPWGYHPGYDEAAKSPLYNLKRQDTSEDLPMSLYSRELMEI